MKKIIVLMFSFFLLPLQVNAANIDILPAMQSKTNVQDRVWVGTFQLVWNEFSEKIVHSIIKFSGGTPVTAEELNKQSFRAEELSGKCYYLYSGKIKKNTKKIIAKAIKRKFQENSDLLDNLELTPQKRGYIVYAMLKKDFQFTRRFDKLGKSAFKDKEAEYFGIDQNSDKSLREGVKVLFYNNPSDFAVLLDTNGKDEVYLYKTSTAKPFGYIFSDIGKKRNAYRENQEFASSDELKIPYLSFFEEKSFDELCGKRIKGTNLMIEKALETVKFDMDNEGVSLKSEAAIVAMKTSLTREEKPRMFYFDDTFVLFLKEKKKSKPYFALRVYDISNFVNKASE